MDVRITLTYNGESVSFIDQYESRDVAEFMWEDGNYCCDCNRSRFGREHGMDWPELDCSSEQIEATLEFPE